MASEMACLVVPSKVYGILAAGRPCIFLGPENSEVARLIIDAGAGEVIPPERQHTLADRLEYWLQHPENIKTAGKNAREVAKRSSLVSASEAFDNLFKQVLAGKIPIVAKQQQGKQP
jgi:UDP-N-acetylglucosamine:LPS N-acetylglucosamine transferase